MDPLSQVGAESVLFFVAVCLAVGTILAILANRLALPDIVLFLAAGLILGPNVFGVLHVPATSTLSWVILLFATSYILFDGGTAVSLRVLARVWISLTLIVTIGVLVTAGVTGLLAHRVLGISPSGGLLLGAALASTDPATLVPVFKHMRVRKCISQFVISESALNDPVGAILTLTLLGSVMGSGALTGASPWSQLLNVLIQVVLGTAIGLVTGLTVSALGAHRRYGFLIEYFPLVTILAVITAYLASAEAQVSGFMAVFVAGVVVGNMGSFGFHLPHLHHARLEDFVTTTSLVSRMFIFILLGVQVRIDLIAKIWWQGLLIVAVFVLVARPLAVLLSILPDRRAKWTWRELLLLSWTRETGVIPGALASVLIATNAPHADVLAAIIFMAILITVVMQGSTAAPLARRLGLLTQDEFGSDDRDAVEP